MNAIRQILSPEERFWSKVDKSGDCWLWQGGVNNGGYGSFAVDGHRKVMAHRYSVELDGREIPPSMYVCHTCDTPRCVNPAHLFVGTPLDNFRDRIAKGHGSPPFPCATYDYDVDDDEWCPF